MDPRPVSIVAGALSDDLRAAARTARAGGFRGLVVDVDAFPFVLDLSQTGRRELLHAFSSNDVALTALQLSLGGDGLEPRADLDRQVARAGRAMEAAHGLRCPLVLLDLGPLPPAPADLVVPPRPAIDPSMLGRLILPEPMAPIAPPPPSLPAEPAFESSVDGALRAIGGLADRTGVTLALRSSLGSHPGLLRAMRSADAPNFGLDLDPPLVLADPWPLDELFGRFAGLVRHVRLRDGVRGLSNRVQPTVVGEGRTDWDHWFANLRDAGYRGPLTVDPMDLANRPVAASLALSRLGPLLRAG